MKAILLGILASFFFSMTFLLNKTMSDAGGSWMWSASLRYFFMLPLLTAIVAVRRNPMPLFKEMRQHPFLWLWWSFVGFGLFYAPLCFAADYSPAWLVAGTWQFTIIAGSLVVPLFRESVQTKNGIRRIRKRIPFGDMGMSVVILIGIIIMELSQATHASMQALALGMVPILIAAFAYPLGNRKMMALCEGRLDAYQRTLGMTIASLPLWIVLSIIQFTTHGWPSGGQTLQSGIVAIFSGVIATVLFFSATDLARRNHSRLAAVEATQSGEVVFTLLGQLVLIAGTKIALPGYIGLVLVVIGMVLHSFISARAQKQYPAGDSVHM